MAVVPRARKDRTVKPGCADATADVVIATYRQK
jgi:hypothetical protein